jgi:hypothetical protein
MSAGQVSGAVLLILAGMWLLLNAIAGDLAGRLLSYAKGSK